MKAFLSRVSGNIFIDLKKGMFEKKSHFVWMLIFSRNSIGMKFLALKGLYEEVAQQAELWSKWLSIIAIKVTPFCGTMFLLGTSFFLYLVNDLGNDSFLLAVPMW